VEIDGRPHEGRAAEDHKRDRAVKRSGIWLVERFASVDVLRDAPDAVRTLQGMLRHYRRTA
jgi:very-short-patch-repair endonuclease